MQSTSAASDQWAPLDVARDVAGGSAGGADADVAAVVWADAELPLGGVTID